MERDPLDATATKWQIVGYICDNRTRFNNN